GGGALAEGSVGGGVLSASVDVERAAGRLLLLPRARWEKARARGLSLFAGGAGVSAPTLVETGAASLTPESPSVERPRGWTGEAGLRWRVESGRDTTSERFASNQAAPGPQQAPGAEVDLAVVGWTLRNAGFPAFGL